MLTAAELHNSSQLSESEKGVSQQLSETHMLLQRLLRHHTALARHRCMAQMSAPIDVYSSTKRVSLTTSETSALL